MGSNFIQGAIKRPGALTAAVGKSKGGGMDQAAAQAATSSPGRVGQEARFYENVLKPANQTKKRAKNMRMGP